MSSKVKTISEREFTKLVQKHNLRSLKMIKACSMVLVEGTSRRAASIAADVNYASVHRTIRKLQGQCPHCGQLLPVASK